MGDEFKEVLRRFSLEELKALREQVVSAIKKIEALEEEEVEGGDV